MRLTTKGRYAVRALYCLSSYQTDRPTPLSEVAKRQNISLNFLEQLFVHLRQLKSRSPPYGLPSAVDPVRMSCRFGVSPRPLTTSPLSVSAVCLVRLLSPCSCSTSLAITSPLALPRS